MAAETWCTVIYIPTRLLIYLLTKVSWEWASELIGRRIWRKWCPFTHAQFDVVQRMKMKKLRLLAGRTSSKVQPCDRLFPACPAAAPRPHPGLWPGLQQTGAGCRRNCRTTAAAAGQRRWWQLIKKTEMWMLGPMLWRHGGSQLHQTTIRTVPR